MPLNRLADGPFAYVSDETLDEWEDTSYLIDCVEDNNEVNNASWSDWSDASDIVDLYVRTSEDPDTLEVIEERRRPGLRGIEILNRAIAGEDPVPLMNAWLEDLYGQ